MKTKILLAWRILVATGMIAILFVGGLITYEYLKKYKRDKARAYYSYRAKYSDNYEHEWHDGKVRLKSTKTGKYITPAFDNIYEGRASDTLTVFFTENKRGFLDVYAGKIVIPAQYERAWIFSEGLGAVVKGDKLGFINKSGELAIPLLFNWKSQSGEKGSFVFQNGYCTVFDSSGKHGMINKKGEWVIQAKYDHINNPENGYRIVFNDGKYGLLNDNLEMVFPLEYDKIALEKEGVIVRNGSSQKLYDYDGKVVLQPFVYDSLHDLYYNSGKENESGDPIYAKSDYMSFFVGDNVGLIDKNGHVVVPAIYREISAISNDLFSCRVAEYGYYITINRKGEQIQ